MRGVDYAVPYLNPPGRRWQRTIPARLWARFAVEEGGASATCLSSLTFSAVAWIYCCGAGGGEDGGSEDRVLVLPIEVPGLLVAAG